MTVKQSKVYLRLSPLHFCPPSNTRFCPRGQLPPLPTTLPCSRVWNVNRMLIADNLLSSDSTSRWSNTSTSAMLSFPIWRYLGWTVCPRPTVSRIKQHSSWRTSLTRMWILQTLSTRMALHGATGCYSLLKNEVKIFCIFMHLSLFKCL